MKRNHQRFVASRWVSLGSAATEQKPALHLIAFASSRVYVRAPISRPRSCSPPPLSCVWSRRRVTRSSRCTKVRATLSFRRQSCRQKFFQRAILLDGKRPCCCHAQSSPRCSNRFASTKSSFLLVSLPRECHGGLTLGYRDETQCAGDRRCLCLCRRNPIGGLLSFLSAVRKNETRGLLNHDRAFV